MRLGRNQDSFQKFCPLSSICIGHINLCSPAVTFDRRLASLSSCPRTNKERINKKNQSLDEVFGRDKEQKRDNSTFTDLNSRCEKFSCV